MAYTTACTTVQAVINKRRLKIVEILTISCSYILQCICTALMVKYGDILVKVLSSITKAAMLQTENHSKKTVSSQNSATKTTFKSKRMFS